MTLVELAAVCGCSGSTIHRLEGLNGVGRPVWRCTECDEKRVGPSSVDAGDAVAATDGGESR